MAIGRNWGEIWDEDIWDINIWAQTASAPPGAVSAISNWRRHTVGLASYRRR